jgi:hypothetical protein
MHDNLKFKIGNNVTIEKYGRRDEITEQEGKSDEAWVPPANGIM